MNLFLNTVHSLLFSVTLSFQNCVLKILCLYINCKFWLTVLYPPGYILLTNLYTLIIYFGEGNGTPLQYSCLENPMDGGAWKAAIHEVAEGQTRLSDFTFTFHFHALEKEMATHSCSCLENPRDRGAWWAAIYGVAQSWTRLKRLSSSSIYLNVFGIKYTGGSG